MQETALWIPRGAFCPLEGGPRHIGTDTLAPVLQHKPSLINTYKIVTGYIHILVTRNFWCTYPEQPVCTSLPFVFILLFIKSQYTVFLHILLFCTSYCFALLFHCTFYSYFSFLPYICSCVVLLLYNSYFLFFCTVH